MSLTLDLNGRRVAVADLAEARERWVEFRDERDLGASDCKSDCGSVRDEAGALVARVSYNGRLWALDGSEVRS